MATMTRKIKFTGTVESSPVAATVLLNGVEAYSGQIGIAQPLNQPGVDLLELEFQGSDTDAETLAVSVSVTSGVGVFALVFALRDGDGDGVENWGNPYGSGNDGRTQILINGLAPEWPATPVDPMPGGTPENPDWSGWGFEVSAGETLTFNYDVLSYIDIVPEETPPA